jgi:hypothetical protein
MLARCVGGERRDWLLGAAGDQGAQILGQGVGRRRGVAHRKVKKSLAQHGFA